jgi:hypothetical protein
MHSIHQASPSIAARKIRRIESNSKCRHQKSDLEGDFAAGIYLSEAPSPPRFLTSGSEFGQIPSVKLPQNMVSNTIQHTPTPSSSHNVCIYCILTTEKGGEVTREKDSGTTGESTDHKAGLKMNVGKNWLSPVNKL